MSDKRVAELAYSKEHDRLELVLPHGTKIDDFPRIFEIVFNQDLRARLPRGCPACTSGDHLIIRERLEHVIRVDLEKRTILE